jgi:hypothetical protein
MVKWSACFIILVTIGAAAVTCSRAYEDTPTATDLRADGNSAMPEETILRDLFDRWERVWHEGQYDLISDCVQPNYIRHDEAGDRTGNTRVLRDRDCQDAAGATALTIHCV